MTTSNQTKTILASILFFIFFLTGCVNNQKPIDPKAYSDSITDQRTKTYLEMIDSTVSRFNSAEREHFLEKRPSYFAPDLDYLVEADFVVDTSTPIFQMQTTTERKPNYRIYGYLNFTVKDTLQKLTVYQNYDYKDHPEYGKTLFVPFLDNTNEFSTYGGGRYMDIPIPTSSKTLLDFNTAFNPYCAYADRWSCPLVPRVNQLNVAIFAGEKKYK
jgi:uncharacterized protein